METMPYHDISSVCETIAARDVVTTTDWRQGLPMLSGGHVTLRDLRQSDAHSLFALLTTDEVSRFISPPPSTVSGFERFIDWAHNQRRAGSYACFAVTLQGFETAIGIVQVRELEPGFGTAEWGFALGSPFWGTGVFVDAARLAQGFAFETLRVHRLEARASVQNMRGRRALQKVGAIQEATLRKSFLRHGEHLDQVLYGIIDDDWRRSPTRYPYK